MIGDKETTGNGSTGAQEADLGAAVGRIAERLGGMLRDGTDLVRISVRQEVEGALRRLIGVFAAGFVAFIGLLLFANGLALWLSRFLGRAGGYLIVGLVFVLIAGIVIAVAGRSAGEKRR